MNEPDDAQEAITRMSFPDNIVTLHADHVALRINDDGIIIAVFQVKDHSGSQDEVRKEFAEGEGMVHQCIFRFSISPHNLSALSEMLAEVVKEHGLG